MPARRLATAVAALLVAGGCGAADSERASSDGGRDSVVEIVAPDASRAAQVPVVGATPVEEEVAREALARLGRSGAVERVEFGDRYATGAALDRQRRVLSTTVRDDWTTPAGRVRAFAAGWLAVLFGRHVVARLDARGSEIDFFETFGTEVGGSLDEVRGPTPQADELSRLGRRIVARARRARLDLERVTAYRLHSGAVAVSLRLTARQVLRGTNTRWRSTLLRGGELDRYSLMLALVAPDGAPLAYGASLDRSDGARWYGRSSPATHRASPPLPDGPTRLSIEIGLDPTRAERRRFRLDCEGRGSRGIGDPATVCGVLEREWLALLSPVAADAACSRLRETMTVVGIVGGVPVSRDYADCHVDTTRRWLALLRVRR